MCNVDSELYRKKISVYGNTKFEGLWCEKPGSSVAGYGLGDRSSIPDRGGGFFLYPVLPAGCGARVVSCTGVQGVPSLRAKGGRGVMPTTHPV
jgi:hypothetical protein